MRKIAWRHIFECQFFKNSKAKEFQSTQSAASTQSTQSAALFLDFCNQQPCFSIFAGKEYMK